MLLWVFWSQCHHLEMFEKACNFLSRHALHEFLLAQLPPYSQERGFTLHSLQPMLSSTAGARGLPLRLVSYYTNQDAQFIPVNVSRSFLAFRWVKWSTKQTYMKNFSPSSVVFLYMVSSKETHPGIDASPGNTCCLSFTSFTFNTLKKSLVSNETL